MRVLVHPTTALAAVAAADHLSALVESVPCPTLGLATGSSPQALYAELASRVRAGGLDLSRVNAFALDEYVGLPPEHPESYHSVVHRDATVPLGLTPERVHVPRGDGSLGEVDAAATDYEAAIADAGGVDLQILGIGGNGHIGFNEPGSTADSGTRRVDLAPATIRANSRFFASIDLVPVQAVTQGIGTILRARSIVLLASGEAKAEAVRAAVEGPVDASCPASFLRLHGDVALYLDEAAASRLSLTREPASSPTA